VYIILFTHKHKLVTEKQQTHLQTPTIKCQLYIINNITAAMSQLMYVVMCF